MLNFSHTSIRRKKIFTRTGPLNSRTCPVNARVSIVLTQLAWRAVLAATQHRQSGPQRSCWLESTWPFQVCVTQLARAVLTYLQSEPCPLLHLTCPAGSSD